MAKVTISRIFELSQYLATKAGQELHDALTYISELSEVTLRLLRNNLTYRDNFDCEMKSVIIRHGVESKVQLLAKKRPIGVSIMRVVSDKYYAVDSFGWKFDVDGGVVVRFDLKGPPATTETIQVDLVIFF